MSFTLSSQLPSVSRVRLLATFLYHFPMPLTAQCPPYSLSPELPFHTWTLLPLGSVLDKWEIPVVWQENEEGVWLFTIELCAFKVFKSSHLREHAFAFWRSGDGTELGEKSMSRKDNFKIPCSAGGSQTWLCIRITQRAFEYAKLKSQAKPTESESLGLDYRNLNYCKILEPSDICSIKFEVKAEDRYNLSKGSYVLSPSILKGTIILWYTANSERRSSTFIWLNSVRIMTKPNK